MPGALLLARIYEALSLLCARRGAEMRIIAFITEATAVRKILAQLGEETSPPRIAPARGPPLWEMADAGQGEFDPQAQPAHRTSNSISASPGRCQRDELRRPSWGDSCLWAQDRPTASGLLPTGSDCGAIQAVSQELSARNPRLTSLPPPAILPKAPLNFLSSCVAQDTEEVGAKKKVPSGHEGHELFPACRPAPSRGWRDRPKSSAGMNNKQEREGTGMSSKNAAGFLCVLIAYGCANSQSIYRTVELGSETAGQAIAIDAKQRVIFSSPRPQKNSTDATGNANADKKVVVYCPEPSPDALSAYSSSGSLTNFLQAATPSGQSVKDQLQAAFAKGEAAASIGLRTQSIQLLRDQMFWDCIAYMNDAVTPDQFNALQRRSQNFTLGILAIEQLTEVVKAEAVALSTASSAATGANDLTNEKTVLTNAQKNQDEAQTRLEASKTALDNANEEVKAQTKKRDDAIKAMKNVPKDADDDAKTKAKTNLETEEKTLDSMKITAETKKIDYRDRVVQLETAQKQVTDAQDSLIAAQLRVRASASGSARVEPSERSRLPVTNEVATAVENIVRVVLNESGRIEACLPLMTEILVQVNKQNGTEVINKTLVPVLVNVCKSEPEIKATKAALTKAGGPDETQQNLSIHGGAQPSNGNRFAPAIETLDKRLREMSR
jgi:hypothetical protein